MQFRPFQMLTGAMLIVTCVAGCVPYLNVVITRYTYIDDNIMYALSGGQMTMDDIRLRQFLEPWDKPCAFMADYSNQRFLQQEPRFNIFGTPGTSGFNAQLMAYGLFANPSSCFELDHVFMQTPLGLTIHQPINLLSAEFRLPGNAERGYPDGWTEDLTRGFLQFTLDVLNLETRRAGGSFRGVLRNDAPNRPRDWAVVITGSFGNIPIHVPQ